MTWASFNRARRRCIDSPPRIGRERTSRGAERKCGGMVSVEMSIKVRAGRTRRSLCRALSMMASSRRSRRIAVMTPRKSFISLFSRVRSLRYWGSESASGMTRRRRMEVLTETTAVAHLVMRMRLGGRLSMLKRCVRPQRRMKEMNSPPMNQEQGFRRIRYLRRGGGEGGKGETKDQMNKDGTSLPSLLPSLPNHAPTTKQVHGNFRGNEEVGHSYDQIGRAHGGHAWAMHGRSFVRRVGRRRRRRRRCSQGPRPRSRWPAPLSRWPALSITPLYMPPRLRQRRGRC